MTLSTTDWLTLALVVITGFYAWATFKILRANEGVVEAMREQTEAQLRPYVVASAAARIGTTFICLEIQNTGKSPATNLTLRMDKDFYPHGERREHENLAKLSAFTETIESMAPGFRMVFNLGVGATIFARSDESLCPRVFRIHASYSHAGRSYTEDHVIDLRPILHSAVVFDPIADEIKRLRESLENHLRSRQGEA